MECYCDKHHAASHNSYTATVWQLHEDYIRPQENGSHFDCDYVMLAGDAVRLTAVGTQPFSFNASHYTQEELTGKPTIMNWNPAAALFCAWIMPRTALAPKAAAPACWSSTAWMTPPLILAAPVPGKEIIHTLYTSKRMENEHV